MVMSTYALNNSEIIDSEIDKLLPCKTCEYLYCDDRLINYVDVQVRGLDVCPCYKISKHAYSDEEIVNILINRKILHDFNCIIKLFFDDNEIKTTNEGLELIQKELKKYCDKHYHNKIDEVISTVKEELIKSECYTIESD